MATNTLEAPAVNTPHGQLTHPLHKLRAGIRTFVTIDILLFVGVFAVFFLWLGIGFDYGLFKLTGLDIAQQTPKGLRIASFAFLLALLGFLVFTRIHRLMTRDFSYPSLAMVLEKRFPKLLGDRLITAVELSDVKKAERQGYSGEMIRQTIDEARERVGQINVNSVFRWSRLYWKAAYIGLFMLLGLGTAVAIHAIVVRGFQPSPFAHKLSDVVTIWGERNVLMRNTPWPRRSHLELVDFPASGELRVGKDSGTPRVKARAYKWVIVDRGSYNGWRPLAWTDLGSKTLAITAPNKVDVADTASAGAMKTLDLDKMLVDDVEAQVGAGNGDVAAVFARLETVTADPWMSRTVRQLIVPKDLKLSFTGASGKTRGDVNLTREPSGEFAGDVTGIAENVVSFVVSGEDFRTPTKGIQLIPKPVLIELKRDEYVPAYLYHAAPQADPKNPGTPSGQAALRGLRQKFADKRISLTGDRSVFSVPVGTELEITATADKKLKSVSITPKTGNVPAFSREATDEATGFETFTVPFRGGHAITEQTEFEYTMTDFDNVSAKRSILIQVTEDQPPTVELLVDVLRKVGNAYMVTPIVQVPFSTDSSVKDDTGLSNLEFEFSYTRQESQVVQMLQAQLAAGLSNAFGSPVPNWGTPALIGANDTIYRQFSSKNDNKTYRKYPVMRFQQDYGNLRRETYDRLKQKVNEPLKADEAEVLKLVKLMDPKFDFFDLRDAAPGLLAKGEGENQPHYRVELNLVATDVNAELVGKNGKPIVGKTGQNLETIQFLVVSEPELLIEISKDEKTQLDKLEELYKRVVDAQAKLNQEIGYLKSPSKDQIENSRIRAIDILQDVAKSKEQLSGIQIEYERLYRELAANRFATNQLEKYLKEDGSGILNHTRRLIDGTEAKGNFPLAENALTAFQTALNNGAAPDEVTTNIARNEVARLIAALDDLRSKTGKAADKAELIKNLLLVIREAEFLKVKLGDLARDEIRKLREPSIAAAKPVSVAAGGTVPVKHLIEWKLYDKGELYIRIDTPKDSELKVPAELTIKDDVTDFSFNVTAGMKPGSYVLTLVPGVGKPVEVQVIVTK